MTIDANDRFKAGWNAAKAFHGEPFKPPVTHEQIEYLADYIFSHKPEEQRQCFIDVFNLIDWKVMSELKP